jgi:hypothetical protein
MIAIVIVVLVIIAFATLRTARQTRLPDADQAARLEMKRAAKSDARGALLIIGLPILVVAYVVAKWFA